MQSLARRARNIIHPNSVRPRAAIICGPPRQQIAIRWQTMRVHSRCFLLPDHCRHNHRAIRKYNPRTSMPAERNNRPATHADRLSERLAIIPGCRHINAIARPESQSDRMSGDGQPRLAVRRVRGRRRQMCQRENGLR